MPRKWYASTVVIMLVVLALSWFSYVWPAAQVWLLGGVLLAVFVASCYRLLFGVAAVFAELVIGSQGHLVGQLRLGLFLVVFLAGIIWIIRQRHIALLHTRYWKWYAAVAVVLSVAAVTALWHGNNLSYIFLDLNGYLFIAMVIPFTQAIRSEADLKKLLAVFWAGVTVLIIETVVILFVFSHQAAFQYYLPDLYRWLRDFRLAEITTQDNNFTRIFFQSHLYVLFALIVASLQFIHTQRSRLTGIALGATLLLLFISYSRSFWVGTIAVLVLLTMLAYRQHVLWRYLGAVVVSGAIGYVLVLGIINLPLFGSGAAVDVSSLLTDRSDVTTDVGGGSRLALVQPLALAALEHPLLGSGFGRTVSYATKDPRALSTSRDGLYTTYAFEWGYLDLWLKLGLVGTLLFVSVIGALAVRLWYLRRYPLAYVASVGVMAVGIVHFFTPYLNHPLGLGWVVFATAIACVYDHTSR